MAGGVGMNAAKYVLAGGLAVVGPHKPAVVNGGESTSYGDLAVRVSRFAGALREAGMKPGDRVALFMLDHADLVSMYLAVIAAGGVAVAVSTRATGDDLRHILAIIRPFAVIAESDFAPAVTTGIRAECKIISPPAPSAVVDAKIRDGVCALCPQAGRSGLLGDDVRHNRTA